MNMELKSVIFWSNVMGCDTIRYNTTQYNTIEAFNSQINPKKNQNTTNPFPSFLPSHQLSYLTFSLSPIHPFVRLRTLDTTGVDRFPPFRYWEVESGEELLYVYDGNVDRSPAVANTTTTTTTTQKKKGKKGGEMGKN